MADDAELRSLLDQAAIRHLHAAYGDAVTRRAWDELVPLFRPDCPITIDLRDGRMIEHVGPQAIGAFIAGSIERFEFFEFVPLNAVVTVDGETATGRLYMCELRQDADSHRWTNAFGLYLDTFVRRDGSWQYASRNYSSLARTSPDAGRMDVFTVPA